MNPSHSVEDPAIEGSDYVALVIEWDDIADIDERIDLDSFDEPATVVREALRPPRPLALATVIGAIGVLALAAWGVHRLATA